MRFAHLRFLHVTCAAHHLGGRVARENKVERTFSVTETYLARRVSRRSESYNPHDKEDPHHDENLVACSWYVLLDGARYE
jgi:hypothetical protein